MPVDAYRGPTDPLSGLHRVGATEPALVAALAWPALVLYIVFSMGRGARNRG